MSWVWMGCITALRKEGGGVRGIKVGDILRRLVSKTIAQQISKVSSRALPERSVHEGGMRMQALTVLFDLFSRRSAPFREAILWNPSAHTWEDDMGYVHEVARSWTTGQTNFGQRLWPKFGWPTLAKPTLANFSVLIRVLAKFSEPEKPKPQRPKPNLREGADPSGPHPSGPTYSGFGVVVVMSLWLLLVWTSLDQLLQDPLLPPPLDPLRRTTQIFSFFFPLPPQVSFFLCLSGCLLVEFWWFLSRRNLELCTIRLSGCRVKPLPLWGCCVGCCKLVVVNWLL